MRNLHRHQPQCLICLAALSQLQLRDLGSTDEGRLYLFVAIDRVGKFAFAELHEPATRRVAAEFLRRVVERVPYRITQS